jgi:hypothetical protein
LVLDAALVAIKRGGGGGGLCSLCNKLDTDFPRYLHFQNENRDPEVKVPCVDNFPP